ncbi:hypothetical protein C3L33_09260, partial [Rhododendron williamsianum]
MKRPYDGGVDGREHSKKSPVFISKAQREQIPILLPAKAPSSDHHPSSHDHRERERDSEQRAKDCARRLEKLPERKKEKEIESIKEQYLGSEKPKKRVIKPGDKFRFSFDWENTEDTSRDMNFLYQNPHETRLLFGRGFRAGVDRREQKKLAPKNDRDLREEIRKKDGAEERPEEEAALVGQEPGGDDGEGPEDFSLSYEGSRIPRPMRRWAERRAFKGCGRRGWVQEAFPHSNGSYPIGVATCNKGMSLALPKLVRIEEETAKFARYLGIRVVLIVGGQSIEEQGFKIRQGCEVVIATPGRLIDCLERRFAVLNQCNYVVLDEADRMIDMGFEPQVVGVLDAMPSSNFKPKNEDEELDKKKIYQTTCMFSATMPPAVERLARKYLRNPVVVTIGTAGKATDLISQHVIMVKHMEKLSREKLVSKGFREKRYNILVATDVAGHGIDIPDVAHVINYDMPGNIEMYTHRIGRTDRAGKTGVATTFLTLGDSDVVYDLKQMLIQSNSPVPPELARHKSSKFKPGTIPDRPPKAR